ncbi:MAG TPA: hypothetical protein PKJ08_06725 [Candidatus Cloacimonadota bacterium]|nr:hypothetical protein [Candidatus Cloacimonadota bacterium]
MLTVNGIPLQTYNDKHSVHLSYAGDDSKRQIISRMFLVRYT